MTFVLLEVVLECRDSKLGRYGRPGTATWTGSRQEDLGTSTGHLAESQVPGTEQLAPMDQWLERFSEWIGLSHHRPAQCKCRCVICRFNLDTTLLRAPLVKLKKDSPTDLLRPGRHSRRGHRSMASLVAGPGRLRVGIMNSSIQRQCSSCAPGGNAFIIPRRILPRPSNGPAARLYSQNSGYRPRFSNRLRDALKNSKIQWYQLPIGVGIGFVGLMQFYKTTSRERERQELEERTNGEGLRPKKRERIRPDGPWQVQVMSTLPLKAISRLWGRFNELDIPYYLRVPGFKLYSWIFGVK